MHHPLVQATRFGVALVLAAAVFALAACGSAEDPAPPAQSNNAAPVSKLDESVTAATATMVLDVEGMTCAGCEGSVVKALSALPEVAAVNVSAETGKAYIQCGGEACDGAKCADAVTAAGYAAKVAE